MSHDQNFKNLILDYPRESLAFFAAEEAGDGFAEAEITPLRQEQLKERLGERFRELDVPLLVTCVNLPNMAKAPGQRVELYAAALRGLERLESDPEKRLKYFDFVETYAALNADERRTYQQTYSPEANNVSAYLDLIRQQARQQAASGLILRMLQRKFGELSPEVLHRVESADPNTLLEWSDRIITADKLDDVLH